MTVCNNCGECIEHYVGHICKGEEVTLADISKTLGMHLLIKTNKKSTIKLVYNPLKSEYYLYQCEGHGALPIKHTHTFNKIQVSLAIDKYNTLLRYNG